MHHRYVLFCKGNTETPQYTLFTVDQQGQNGHRDDVLAEMAVEKADNF